MTTTSSSGGACCDSVSSSSTSTRSGDGGGGFGESVCLDMGMVPWGGQSYVVSTSRGPISVVVCGEQYKPALITYPDLALDTVSCFQGLFSCPEASSLLFHNFCVYHIDAPGHEFGAPVIPSEVPVPSVDDLADQVAEVCDHFGLQEVICMGVTAGAYILSLFAMKFRERVLGLILVSPLCRAPTWSEWLYDKAMFHWLYFFGITSFVREILLERYFSQDTLTSADSAVFQTTFRKVFDERQSRNVLFFWKALHQRKDITAGLRNLNCRTLVVVGEQSPFYNEAIHIARQMKPHSALVAVQGCGSLVTDEQPLSMLVPLEYFMKTYGFFSVPTAASSRSGSSSPHSTSPTSPLSPPCIHPDLLSSQGLGLNLKPIKTRVSAE